MEQKDQMKRDRDDVEWVTSTEQGRRFMWRVLSHCQIYHDIGGSKKEMLKQVGKRQVGLFLLGIISDASEDRVFEMMREAKNRSLEEKEAYERANRNQTNRAIINTVEGLIDSGDSSTGGLPSYSSFGGAIF